MKKIMVAIMISGCIFAGFASATTLSFSENQILPVALSNTNIDRVVVANDKINNIICPAGFCTSKHDANDQSGAAFVQVLTQNQFTLYVSTVTGHQVGLDVTPTKSDGNTLVLNPSASNTKAQTWETASSYQTMLIALVHDMINGIAPDGYGFTPVKNADSQKIFNGDGTLTMQAVWTGNYLVGISYVFKNLSKKALTLSDSNFYHQGVRLVAAVDQKVDAGESTIVYEILSKNT